jgi:prepilin-type N-terminal cleavage/methylation domain-containing protein
MNTRKQKKSGFTLVELMVVAIIVAILAAVAIPLMTGNKDRAMATEGQAGCTTIATQLRMHWAEFGNYDGVAVPTDLAGIKPGDLTGTYYETYQIAPVDGQNYVITAVGKDDAAGKNVVMNVVAGEADWDQSFYAQN